MDIALTILLIIGIAFIGIAIFAKIRPDIIWKDRVSETILPPERQKFGFILLLLLGIMMLVSAGAISIPQWQSHIDAILISIVMVTISVVLFMMWKYILSQDKRWSRIALAAVLLLSVGLFVFAGYYWYTSVLKQAVMNGTLKQSIMFEKIVFFVVSLLIVSGFVWLAIRVKRHPERDKFMQKVMKEQKGVDYEKGMQKCLIFFYLSFGVSLVLFNWLGNLVDPPMILTINVALFLALFIVGWRYTGDFSKWVFLILAVLLSLGIGYHIWASQSSKVEVLPDMLSIGGNYSQTIPYEGIDSVFVVNELPKTKYCKDGHNLFRGKRGEYRLENGSVAKFYVLGNEGPYLMMYTYPGLVFVNRKTPAETEQLIEELRDRIGDKMIGSVGLALPK